MGVTRWSVPHPGRVRDRCDRFLTCPTPLADARAIHRARHPPLDLATGLDLLLESTQATHGSLPSALRAHPRVVAVAYGCVVGAAWAVSRGRAWTAALRLAPRLTRFKAGTHEGPDLTHASGPR